MLMLILIRRQNYLQISFSFIVCGQDFVKNQKGKILQSVVIMFRFIQTGTVIKFENSMLMLNTVRYLCVIRGQVSAVNKF